MKKHTTKLLSVLLTLVMLLGLLPTTAFAAEKETIPSISATVTLPTAGAYPVETGTPGDSSYKIMKVRFSMQMGAQEIALLPTARISGFSPSLQIFDLPFLFPDKETAYEIFDGEVGATILETLESTGVKGLAVYEDGFKHFTCSEKIETLEDFAGKKFRTMESPIIMEQFNSLKANPVPVDFAELYNALQQKTVEGQENPLATIVPMGFYEVQDYMLLSGHAYLAQMFLVGGTWFDSLSAEDQELITRIAKEVAVWEREVVAAEEENYLQTVRDSGTTIIELSEAERLKMKEATASVYDVAKDIVGEDLLNMVVEAASK